MSVTSTSKSATQSTFEFLPGILDFRFLSLFVVMAMRFRLVEPSHHSSVPFILKAAVEVSAEAHFGGSTVEVLDKGPFGEERGNRSAFTCRVNDSNCGAVAMHPAEVVDI